MNVLPGTRICYAARKCGFSIWMSDPQGGPGEKTQLTIHPEFMEFALFDVVLCSRYVMHQYLKFFKNERRHAHAYAKEKREFLDTPLNVGAAYDTLVEDVESKDYFKQNGLDPLPKRSEFSNRTAEGWRKIKEALEGLPEKYVVLTTEKKAERNRLPQNPHWKDDHDDKLREYVKQHVREFVDGFYTRDLVSKAMPDWGSD